MPFRLVFGLLFLMSLSAAAVLFAVLSKPVGSPASAVLATTTIETVATTNVTKPTIVVKPIATSTPVEHPVKEVTLKAYLTGYAWPDNTPPGSDISHPVLHQEAGGTGTYADPITVAIGHSFINGKDIMDYAAGTVFYMPYLHKYFIAEDTCGDGDTPQNVPCHNLHKAGNEAPAGTEAWLDLWVGGVGSLQSDVLKCEDAITGLHTVLLKPASNYVVSAGAVYDTSCVPQFSDTPIKI
jgi:hypothetical protein